MYNDCLIEWSLDKLSQNYINYLYIHSHAAKRQKNNDYGKIAATLKNNTMLKNIK